MSLGLVQVDKVVLSDKEGNDFMEFSFQYHKDGHVGFSFDIDDFQEVFVDNYSSGEVSVLFFKGKHAMGGFLFPDEGVSTNDDTEYLYLLSEILAFEIIKRLPE
jgi:hypothetical protein